jgi:methanogenic corrinoid protein MtbC1
MTRTAVTLREASDRLGVHYMTAYRYVRTGRLVATRRDGEWEVALGDLERLQGGVQPPAQRGHPRYRLRVPALGDRLVANDEPGAWALVESVLAGGATPSDVYTELFTPALRLIGERWERGDIGVADEHSATVTMQRLIGRMGPSFRRRGRSRGVLVLGTPEGELHALPTALAADLLRAQGFAVIDLGGNVPTDSFVECVRRVPGLLAVGIAVTSPDQQTVVGRLVHAQRRAKVTAPIIVGGAGLSELDARRIAPDHFTRSAESLVRLISGDPDDEQIRGTARRARRR